MLSGGKRDWWKTTVGLISNLFCTTNNMKLPETSWLHVLWRKCRTCSCSLLFSLSLIFTPLAFLIFSPALQNGMLFLQQKMSSLFFLSRSSSFSRWASLACRLTFSFSLSFSSSIFHICGHDNWSKLNTLHNRIQKQFPLSVFVFIDSLVVSALQDAGGYAISRQNNLELHLGCHTCWLSYFTLVCPWCGRTVGRSGGRAYGHVATKCIGYQIFLPMDLRYLQELRYNPVVASVQLLLSVVE